MPSLSQLPFVESLSIATTIRFGANKILIDAAGREQRIVPHQSPIREFNVFKKALTPAEGNALFALFESTEGRKNTFLYQDKSDYAATRTPKTLATGVYTQGVVLNIAGQYLLCKKYVCGANTHYRPIYSANDLIIYNSGGTVVSGSFATGGLITGLTGSGHTASFTFDLPVRFSEDSIDRVIETKKVNKLYSVSLTLIEQRFSLPAGITDIFLDDCAHQFAIDFLFKSTTSQVFNNQVKDLTSGFNKIVQYQSDPITEIVFGERSAIPAVDLEYLQAFWLCVKGSGAFWDFEDDEEVVVKAAFRDNALSYTLTAPQPQQYSVAPLTARLFYEGIVTDAGHSGWTGSVLTLCDCVMLREAIAAAGESSFSQTFNMSTPNGVFADVGEVFTFTLTASNPAVPNDAEIYLVSASWTHQGSIGSYTSDPATQPDPPFVNAASYSGPEILIGAGNSVTATASVISTLGIVSYARVNALLRFVW